MVTRSQGNCTFRIRCPNAPAVYLAGQFNEWSLTANPMAQVAPDIWQISLKLPPGAHRFRYFIPDGRWITDFAGFGVVPNGFDGWDSVVYVPDPSEEVVEATPEMG